MCVFMYYIGERVGKGRLKQRKFYTWSEGGTGMVDLELREGELGIDPCLECLKFQYRFKTVGERYLRATRLKLLSLLRVSSGERSEAEFKSPSVAIEMRSSKR